MTTITPTHTVRIHPQHTRSMARREDVAEQREFAALAEAGRDDEVLRRLDAARAACVRHVEARRIEAEFKRQAI